MLPDLPTLLAGYELYARQNKLPPERDEARLAEALEEARTLAGGHALDEPAALLYALAGRPRVFGRAHGRMTLHLVIEQAHALGVTITVDVAVLELLRARIVRRAMDFEELRAWFEAHLATVPRKPWPPR